MTALRIKWGGTAWQAPLGNGKAFVKWGGSAWTSPNHIKVKSGAVGAGSWVDTGYVGLPATPTAVQVTAWDTNNVIMNWTAGSGGAPVHHYEYGLTNSPATTWLSPSTAGPATTTATSVTIPVAWDTKYGFLIRAISASGVASAWYDYPNGTTIHGRIGIGHPQQDTYGYVQRTRPWQSQATASYAFRDEALAVGVPSSVYLTQLSWRGLNCPGSGVVTPYNNRTANLYLDSTWGAALNDAIGGHTILSLSSYADIDLALANWGDNGAWGIGPLGVGWATRGGTGNTNLALWASSVILYGSEYYNNYEVTSSIAAAGNYYW